jgi:hypothetical protein
MKKVIIFCILFSFFIRVNALEVDKTMEAIVDYALYIKENYNYLFYYDESLNNKINKFNTFNGINSFEYNNKCLFIMGKKEFISFVFNGATGLMSDNYKTYNDIFLISYNQSWIYKKDLIDLVQTFSSLKEFNEYDIKRGDIVGQVVNNNYNLYIYDKSDTFITITDNYPNSISSIKRNSLKEGRYFIFRINKLVSKSLDIDNNYKDEIVLKTRKNIDFNENNSCITKKTFVDTSTYKHIKKFYLIIMITIMIIINLLNYLAVKDEMSYVKERGIVSIIFRTLVFLALLSIPFIIEAIMKII